MDDRSLESMPVSAIPEVTREHWQSDPVPSVLLERPIRAVLVTATPRESHLVQQAYLSDVVLAELTNIPVEDQHDVPVASLIDDVKRKKDLKKVMGTGNKFGQEGEDDDNVIDAGHPTLPKELVNYRYSGHTGQMCQDCTMFVEPAGCTLVIGMIRPVDTCDRHEPKEQAATFLPSGPVEAQLVQATESHREREFFTKIQAKMETDLDFEAAPYKMFEVSPPDWEGTVLRMKQHPEISNPWALAWYMKGKGYSPHAGPHGGKKKESENETGTPEGAKKGWETRKGGGGNEPEKEPEIDMAHEPEPSQSDKPRVVSTMGKYQKDVMIGDRKIAKMTRVIRGSGFMLRFDDAVAEKYGLKDPERRFPDIHTAVKYVQNKMKGLQQSETEGGPGSGPRKGGGRSKFAPDAHDDEDPSSAMFTRREKPRQRRDRIRRKPVDPETAAAIRRALMSEGVHGHFLGFARELHVPRRSIFLESVPRVRATLLEAGYEDETGTSDGAKKGWEKRKGGGGSAPQWERGGRKPKRSPSDAAPPAKGRGPLKKDFVPGAFDPDDAAERARRAAALTPEERKKIQRSKDRDLAARGISKSPQVSHGLRPAGELADELKRLGVIPTKSRPPKKRKTSEAAVFTVTRGQFLGFV